MGNWEVYIFEVKSNLDDTLKKESSPDYRSNTLEGK